MRNHRLLFRALAVLTMGLTTLATPSRAVAAPADTAFSCHSFCSDTCDSWDTAVCYMSMCFGGSLCYTNLNCKTVYTVSCFDT